MSESESPQHPSSGRSRRQRQRTFHSQSADRERDFDSDLGLSPPNSASSAILAAPFDPDHNDDGDLGLDEGEQDEGGEDDEAVHFCLLAEFDIDTGATLADQYPHPTGTDEQ